MAALEEKLAEVVKQFLVLYDKSCRDLIIIIIIDFKDDSKEKG